MTKKAGRGGGDAGENKKGRKKTMGRQKIEIKRIKNVNALQVCFSKRHKGLFKKASDLSMLCGAHVAAVVFSPGGKPYSFGHPSVDAVVDRFTDPSAPAMVPTPVHPALIEEFNHESDLLAQAIDAEARRKNELEAAMRQAGVWDSAYDVNRASLPELLALLGALERVQAEVALRTQEFIGKEAMTQCTMGADVFYYPGAGTFMADGVVNSHQVVMDTQMMMMGGNVGHAPPFPPKMLLPPSLPQLPFNHVFDLNFGAGYGYEPTTLEMAAAMPPYLVNGFTSQRHAASFSSNGSFNQVV